MTRDRMRIAIDAEKCQRCGQCAAVCPAAVFRWDKDDVALLHPGRCIACGHCVAVCPNEAFGHSELPSEEFSALADEQALDAPALRALLAARRSCRRFSQTTLSREEIEAVLDFAHYAPTPTNSQNVRFIVLSSRASISRFAEWVADYYLGLERWFSNPVLRLLLSLSVGFKSVKTYRYHFPAIVEMFRKTVGGEADRLFYGAPVVVVAVASGIKHLAAASCNLAVMQLLLGAEAMRLGTCINGYALTALVRDKKIRAKLGIPRGLTPGAVIALGRPSGRFRRIPPRAGRKILWTDL